MRLLGRVARHRRGLLGAMTLAVTAGAVVVLVLVTGSPSPTAASGAAKAPAGAATVQRRNLVQTDTEAGTLSYANPHTVYDRLSGTITWLPSVGQVIRPGGTLLRVNGSPVILMNGNAPAYRTLSSADSDGVDVLQLNRNLAALGFNANGIVVDDQWQEATTLGVELLQESLGETATGSLSLGRVVFLPGPQLVSTVEGTVGDTDNGGSSATPTSLTVAPPAPEFVSLTTPATSTTTTTSTSPTATTPATATPRPSPTHHKPSHHKPRKGAGQTPSLAALLALLKAESAQLKAEAEQLKAAQHQNGNAPSGSGNGSGTGGGKGSGTGGGKGGSGGGGSGNNGSGGNSPNSASGGAGSGSTGTAVLETNSNHLVVTVDLDASLQSEAKVGEKVTVQLPAGNTVNGKVTAVSSVAQSSSSGDSGSGGSGSGNGSGGGSGSGSGGGSGAGSSSTIPVTIALSGHHKGAGLDEAAVSVNFAQARANHVLSVPVTALLAVSGGNYAVQEAAAPHTLIPVTVGLFAAGYVQISGPGIHPGLQVTDSQG